MEYQIGDFSKISRLSIKTLRYYHEVGLLCPTRIDNESGYRYYNDNCIEKAHIINELKALEFSISDIKEILANYNEDTDIAAYMKKRLEDINKKLNHYTEIQHKISYFIKQDERKPIINSSKVIIKEIPGILIASIRFKGSYQEVGREISKLFRYCGKYATGSPFCIHYDNEYKEENADIEVCIEVLKRVDKDTIKSRKLQSISALSIIHKGPYESIGTTYKTITDFIKENHIKTGVPSRELYIKGPGLIFKGNPNNYITEIQILRCSTNVKNRLAKNVSTLQY